VIEWNDEQRELARSGGLGNTIETMRLIKLMIVF
jgi:hypothetical protein